MTQKESWFIKLEEGDNQTFGIGEAGPLPGLSLDWADDFEKVVSSIVEKFNIVQWKLSDFSKEVNEISDQLCQRIPEIVNLPSILFALEVAILDLQQEGKRIIYDNEFIQGKKIPINGLIWMGGMDQMLQQIEIKIQENFHCLKLKVGGIDFERECDILQYIRRKYFKMDITLRLDANGAFKPEEVMYKLYELSKYNIHSIEQPVRKGSAKLIEVVNNSPIPVALDEELIGLNNDGEKRKLLEQIAPPFIILKPTLHGGLSGCIQWINIAKQMNIEWWITSALESNIGLNAIAQFVSEFDFTLHQGLGTGKIYSDNFESPLQVKDGFLFCQNELNWSKIED